MSISRPFSRTKSTPRNVIGICFHDLMLNSSSNRRRSATKRGSSSDPISKTIIHMEIQQGPRALLIGCCIRCLCNRQLHQWRGGNISAGLEVTQSRGFRQLYDPYCLWGGRELIVTYIFGHMLPQKCNLHF